MITDYSRKVNKNILKSRWNQCHLTEEHSSLIEDYHWQIPNHFQNDGINFGKAPALQPTMQLTFAFPQP